MKISREDLEPRQVRLTIEVAPERLAATLATVTQELSKRYRIPGFRPGKAPLERVAALVGETNLRQEALERLGKEVVGAALREEKLSSVAPVALELLSSDPPRFGATVSLAPEVELGDYRALRLPEPPPVEVTEADVDQVLTRIRRDLSTQQVVDRPSERGDLLILSIEMRRRAADAPDSEDEADLPENAPVQQILLDDERAEGSALPDGLLEALLGRSAGDVGSVSLPGPEGAEATTRTRLDFRYRIQEVRALELPPLDDHLASRLGRDAASLEDMRADIRSSLQERREQDNRQVLVQQARDALVAGASLRYPPALVQEELREVVTSFRGHLEREGEDWEAWLAQRDEAELWQQFEGQAELNLRRKLVMGEFVSREGLEMEPEQITAGLRVAERLGGRRPRKAREGLQRMMLDSLNDVFNRRVQERLVAIVTGQAEALESPEAASASAEDDADREQTRA